MTDQEGAISGRIADRPVAELFQWLHEGRRTGVARFRTALGTATVWFRDGELVDADMGRFHQDAAVLRLMRIQDGEYEVEPKPVNQRRMIKQSTALLLAEGRQRAPRPGAARGATEPSAPLRSTTAPSVSAVPKSGSGEYSLVRDDSRPRRRDDVGTEPTPAASSGPAGPRGRATKVDTGAHTLLDAKAPPRPPGRPSVTAVAPDPSAGRRSITEVTPAPASAAQDGLAPPSAVLEPQGPVRGPAARPRRGLGWSPTAGGPGQAPEPTPSARSASVVPGRPATDAPRAAPTPPDEPTSRSGRTRFMFGVSGPGAEREPSDPALAARSEATPAGPADLRRTAPLGSSEPAPAIPPHGAAVPGPPPGAVAMPMPPDDSARSPSEGRRRRARAVARAQVPFEPERSDRTMLRPGPLPPPPGQPVLLPGSSSQAIPVAVPLTPSQSIPGVSGSAGIPLGVPATPSQSIPGVSGSAGIPLGVPATPSQSIPGVSAPPIAAPFGAPGRPGGYGYDPPASHTTAIMGSDVAPPRPGPGGLPPPYPMAAPMLIDEEYSHPISVPSVPPMGAGVSMGPNGTWVLSSPAAEKPLPDDPTAEPTVSMRVPDMVLAREPQLSARVKAAGGGTAHVGRYEVLLRLARGGMGTVYLCRVTGEGGFRRLFALKVIRDHLNTNEAYVQMLLEEARIASRLSHPNIVSIIDIDTFAGQHYLVMDYVEGCTFSELLKAHPKARPPELVVPIVLDALTGLHAAHSMRGDDGRPQPVVHCDFSPQNMLVGVNGTCRITDFGVAKAADALQSGPGRGKPGYLSPEQVRGLPLDPRSDVFSAGVVLWNALTGETLFDGAEPQQVLHQVVSRKIPKPSTVGLRPPACFDRICLKALEREPSERYQTAEQMLMDLRKVAIAEDLLAPSSEVGRWVQDTFGAQIELRRQAAGLQPNPVVAALALRDLAAGASGGASVGAAAGLSGHSEGLARDGSITGHDPDASMTMMLRSGAAPIPALEDDREGFGARTRMVVIVGALAFIAAGVVTLLVRPDLLQGGIVDEHGRYVDLGAPPDEGPLTGGDDGEPSKGDASTGAPTPAVAGDTAADTGGAGTGGDETAGTETDGDTEAPAEDDGKATKGKGKGKPKPKAPADGKAPAGDGKAPADGKPKGKGGKPKAKPEPGSDAPPPDLDELFRQPGG